MTRTTIRVPAEDGFDVRMTIATFSQILASYGYQEKTIQGEPCWSKGDGVIVKQQNFGLVIGKGEILLQGWMNDAITGESDLEGMVAVVPKKKMKKILEEIEMAIMPIVSVRAGGSNPKKILQDEKHKPEIREKEEDYNKKIQECRKFISEIFMEIGKQYYELYKERPDERLFVLVNRTKEYYLQIEEYQKKIEELTKREDMCPKCGKEIAEGQVYCSNCGARIQEEPAEEKRNKICTQCGSVVASDGNFCGVCGARV